MNKQELIDKQALINKLLELPGVGSNSDALDTIKRFPKSEPQKPVVPRFVAELLDYYRQSTDVDLLALLITFKDWYYSESKNGKHEEAIDWLVKHPEIYMRAWLFGYEVEKKPLYMVPLLTDKEGNKKILVERRGQYDIIWDYENEDDWHELLTEEQIKSVNPDYWKLAVLYEPSEEVAAG